MSVLEAFQSWDQVLAHVRKGGKVKYHAPLDILPASVIVTVRGQGRKVRVIPLSNQADPFWADEKHLSRFKKIVD